MIIYVLSTLSFCFINDEDLLSCPQWLSISILNVCMRSDGTILDEFYYISKEFFKLWLKSGVFDVF